MQDQAHRVPLARGQPGKGEPCFGRFHITKRQGLPPACPHRGEHPAFRPDRAVGDIGGIGAAGFGFDQLSLPAEPLDRRVDLAEPVAARRVAERNRPNLATGDHGPSFLHVGDGARDHIDQASFGRLEQPHGRQ